MDLADEDIQKSCQHGQWVPVISMLLLAQVGLVVASEGVSVAVEADFEEASEEIAILAVGQGLATKVNVMGSAVKLLLMPHPDLVVDEAVALADQTEIVEVVAGMTVNLEERRGAT